MATDTKPRRQTSSPDVTLRVSAYDSVSSALVAMILFLGFFVVLMFAIWLTKTPSMKTSRRPPGPRVEHLSGRVNPVKGHAHDLSEPGVREIEPLEDPQLEAVEVVSQVRRALRT